MNKTIQTLILFIFPAFFFRCGDDSEKIGSLQREAIEAYSKKDLNRAMQLYSQIEELDSSISNLIMLGKIYYYKKDFPKSKLFFEKAVNKDSCNATAKYWDSKLESLEDGKKENAKTKLSAIIAQIPNRWEVEYTLGSVLESEGKIPEALQLYNQATSETSKLALVYLKLGRIYKKAKQESMAKKYFAKAKFLAEDNPDSLRLVEAELGLTE